MYLFFLSACAHDERMRHSVSSVGGKNFFFLRMYTQASRGMS